MTHEEKSPDRLGPNETARAAKKTTTTIRQIGRVSTVPIKVPRADGGHVGRRAAWNVTTAAAAAAKVEAPAPDAAAAAAAAVHAPANAAEAEAAPDAAEGHGRRDNPVEATDNAGYTQG